MAFPPNTATNGTDAQNLLVNKAAAQGIAEPTGGLSQVDMTALVVANMLTETPTAVVTPAALGTVLAGTADGLGSLHVARATFNPTATAGDRTATAHDLGVTIPISAVVCGGFVVVHTAFTSTNSTSQIAISIQSANDIISAAAVSGAPWSTIGKKAIVPKANTPESTGIELSAARAVTATVSVEALLGGKCTVVLYYIIGAVSA